jgi:hypothetical protein
MKKLKFWKSEKMLFQQLKLEKNRIFSLKRNIIFFTLFGFIGIFFIYSGIREYKNFLNQKEFFITHEQDKMNLYASHGHYGAYGFRVLYEPPPLSIFFNNSSVFENLYSTVDMTENLDVNRSYKGRNLLLKKGFFKDLAGMFFFFGSLFMVYMGVTSYKSEKYFFKFGNVIIRLGILNSVFVILIFAWYNFPKAFQLRFWTGDGEVFFYFVIYLLFFLSFFYGAGLLIRVLCRSKPVSCIYVFIFWFLSVTIIPEAMIIFLQEKSQLLPVNEKYNITKLEEVVNFEREVQKAIVGIKTPGKRIEIYREMAKDFLETGCVKNSKIEKDINSHIQQVVREYEILLLAYPTGFYNYLSGEVSGQGYNGYLGFVNYTLALRHNFIEYYLKKRYDSNDKSIVSLVKDDKNIFYAHCFLPQSFPIAIGLILLYTIILFTVSYVVLKRRIGFMPKIKKPGYEFRKGNTYFVLCKNDRYRDNLFRYYQVDENTIGIDKAKVEELNPGVGLAQMVTYFCKLSGADEKKARENLQLLGVGDIKAKVPRHRWEREKTGDEVVYKIYCAVTMAGTHKIVVVNDFLKGKSREMERQFLDLVTRLNQAGKIVVYLSSEIFLTLLPFEGNIKIDNYKSFRIDPQAVSLR